MRGTRPSADRLGQPGTDTDRAESTALCSLCLVLPFLLPPPLLLCSTFTPLSRLRHLYMWVKSRLRWTFNCDLTSSGPFKKNFRVCFIGSGIFWGLRSKGNKDDISLGWVLDFPRVRLMLVYSRVYYSKTSNRQSYRHLATHFLVL